VDVDEARCHDQACGIDLAPAGAELGIDCGNFSVLDGDIGDPARRARAV
jgi:hypothetical protein